MRAYIDADVLIWHLRGRTEAQAFLRGLIDGQEHELWTGAMQCAEVVFFMRPEEEDATLYFLSHFKTAPIDQATVDEAGRLFRRYQPSHGVDPNDALLAATAKRFGGRIYTLNERHFPMPDVLVSRAW